MEERLDKILVERNFVESRVKAEQIISEVGVKVNGKLINKPGKKFLPDCNIVMVEAEFPWISIEALKLKSAIEKWKIKIDSGVFIDVDCNQGSFSEVLLENAASKVYAVDSKRDLLHLKIKEDKRVVDLTGMYLRELTNNSIVEKLDGCVINDLALSLDKTLPFIHPFLKEDAFLISVIKPQLEVSKENLKNNGSVRNTLGYPEMFETLKKTGKENNLIYVDHMNSPIVGKDGQQEFIMLFKKVN
jgi:23S rRNA (cytidine1920-2'-O)/16S rRNA (cytidine1409-2'-O)-methyltransferase